MVTSWRAHPFVQEARREYVEQATCHAGKCPISRPFSRRATRATSTWRVRLARCFDARCLILAAGRLTVRRRLAAIRRARLGEQPHYQQRERAPREIVVIVGRERGAPRSVGCVDEPLPPIAGLRRRQRELD